MDAAKPRRGGNASPYAFVTVGTTQFDDLVQALDTPHFARALQAHGIARVRIQLGRGAFVPGERNDGAHDVRVGSTASAGSASASSAASPSPALAALAAGEVVTSRLHGITYEMYRLKPSLADDIGGAALVISHAGAGSIFEALRAGRPLLVVVNSSLADNHQVELAEAMAARGHILGHCEPNGLADAVAGANLRGGAPLPTPEANLARFVDAVDSVLGFEKA
jgi:beta-1,4-N-acetylglucosaminyltransferase